MQSAFKTADDYVNSFPKETQAVLEKIRATILKVAPDATQRISYGIVRFDSNNHMLIFMGGFSKHVSIYPIPTGNAEFQELIAPYVAGRGTLKFPLNKPIPYDVIEKVTQRRLELI